MTTARSVTEITDHYVNGTWVPSGGDGTIDVVDPSTEQVIATVPSGTSDDVDRAVLAARRAFPGWAATPVAAPSPNSSPTSSVGRPWPRCCR